MTEHFPIVSTERGDQLIDSCIPKLGECDINEVRDKLPMILETAFYLLTGDDDAEHGQASHIAIRTLAVTIARLRGY